MSFDHAVLVCGHAVYVARDFAQVHADASWFLLPYQAGEAGLYLEHIHRGVELAAADPASLLIFTGGQTRREAGRNSEAGGYLRLAEHSAWWGRRSVAVRAFAEEYARDSLENLLFGLCRFREIAGAWPRRATVVSWAFKRPRMEFHRASIRFPAGRFTFDGPNDPRGVASALESERQFVEAFRSDPYASGGALAERRRLRNPFDRVPPYPESCPEAAGLLAWRGPGPYPGSLPWDQPL